MKITHTDMRKNTRMDAASLKGDLYDCQFNEQKIRALETPPSGSR